MGDRARDEFAWWVMVSCRLIGRVENSGAIQCRVSCMNQSHFKTSKLLLATKLEIMFTMVVMASSRPYCVDCTYEKVVPNSGLLAPSFNHAGHNPQSTGKTSSLTTPTVATRWVYKSILLSCGHSEKYLLLFITQ